MGRLTEKLDQPCSVDMFDVKLNLYEPKNYSTDTEIGACVDKLGEFEDIEEKLSIDLTTLFKALQNGWFFIENNNILHTEGYKGIRLCGFGWMLECRVDNKIKMFKIKDHKKTWALTEEELKKED